MNKQENDQALIELSNGEKAGLEQIAGGEAPHSQRAKALLALSDSADLAAAGISSGLTVNQVRYWLGRFRGGRLSTFPEELLATEESAEEEASEPTMLAAPETSPMLHAPPKTDQLMAGEADAEDVIELPAVTTAAGVAAMAAVSGKSTKKKNKKKKSGDGGKKSKKSKKGKKAKKKEKTVKSKKDKKGEKSKKDKKDKKDKKGKKDKKNKKATEDKNRKKDVKEKKGKKRNKGKNA